MPSLYLMIKVIFSLQCLGPSSDRMVVGFTTVPIASKSCEFEPVHSKVSLVYSIQHYATGRWFSPFTLVSFTNKTDRHDMTEILLKVALNTISLNTTYIHVSLGYIARFTVNNHRLICLNH
jgi:hypothetical protein